MATIDHSGYIVNCEELQIDYSTVINNDLVMFPSSVDCSGNVNCDTLSIVNNELVDNVKNMFPNKVMSTSLFVNTTNVYLSMIKLMLQLATPRYTGSGYRLDLSHMDFQGMDFSNMDLSCLNLSGVNFAGADLSNSNLEHSNLTGVNFSQANLTNVNMHRATITGMFLHDATTDGLNRCHTSGTPAVDIDDILDEGITFKSYNGYFDDNITFDKTARCRRGFASTYTGTVTDLSTLHNATNGNFADGSGQTKFTVTWNGYFYAQVSGTYEFSLTSDDACYFWLDTHYNLRTQKNATINNSGQHSATTKTAKVNLLGGCYYSMSLMYGQNLGDYSFSFTFTPPAESSYEEIESYYHRNDDISPSDSCV